MGICILGGGLWGLSAWRWALGDGREEGRVDHEESGLEDLQSFHPGKHFSGLLGLGTYQQSYFKAHKA